MLPYNSFFSYEKASFMMVRLTLFLINISVSLISPAQSIEKRYSSYVSERGIVNFFRPKKLNNNVNMGVFEFDMTYVSHGDSVTVNCSINVTSVEPIVRAELINGEDKKSGENVYVIYRDITKKGYIVRLSARYPLKDIQECFSNRNPLVFCFLMKNGTTCSASYSPSQWKKDSNLVTRILSSLML